MKRELVIESGDAADRIALLEDGELTEAYLELKRHPSRVEGIYRGRVAGKTAGGDGFIEFGDGSAGFLNGRDLPMGSPALQEGQRLIVQVERDSFPGKLARLTARPRIAGCLAVFQPDGETVRAPQSLRDHPEVETLIDTVDGSLLGEEGVVLRTRAADAGADAVVEEVRRLRGVWSSIRDMEDDTVLSPPVTLVESFIRDVPAGDWSQIVVTGGAVPFVRSCIDRWAPEAADRLAAHHRTAGPFAGMGLEDAWQAAFEPLVRLPSGGELIIEPTQALVAIDVNAGNAGQGPLHVNLEAAAAAAREIRLRNLSGQAVIDFISLPRGEDRNRVLRRLRERCAADRSVFVHGYSKLGLVELTRRRRRRSLPEARALLDAEDGD